MSILDKLDRHRVLSSDKINIFFAGGSFTQKDMSDWGVSKQLISWYHDRNNKQIESYCSYDDHFIILDSGAFSAWQQDIKISVDDYVDAIAAHGDYIGVAANLDVIPGKQGMKATQITDKMKADAAEGGKNNYYYIINKLKWLGRSDLACRVMPIHHQGEPLDVLKRMVDLGCEYVGVSPSNDYSTRQRMVYLDEVFSYLESLPTRILTHGYAVTSEKLMRAYSWFSVDSISWIAKAGFGYVTTPFGNLCFSEDPRSLKNKDHVRIVDDIGENKSELKSSKYVDSSEQILDYIKDKLMMTPLELATNYSARALANIIYLLDYEKNYVVKKRFYEHAEADLLFK